MPPRTTSPDGSTRWSDETERGWQGQLRRGHGFHFERTVRGVKEVAIIDQALLGSADARKLDEYAASLQEIYPRPTPPAMLRRRAETSPSTARSACSRPSPAPAARA